MASLDDHMSLGRIAKVCNVSRTTVYRWVMNGQLQAYMLPSGHYRVRPKDLSRFCTDFGIPDPNDPGSSERIVAPQAGDTPAVLIADDQADVLATMRALVAARLPNAQIETAVNGVETCVAIGSLRPRILLLDIMMPGMDGFSVLEELLRRPEMDHSMVLLVSGYEPFERVQALVERHSQVVGALRKPLDPVELGAKLDLIAAQIAVA